MQRKAGFAFWVVVFLIVVALFLMWQYVGFRSAVRVLPVDITMAGLQAGGMSRGQALNALEVAFATPLEVSYIDKMLSLDPAVVGMSFDGEQTAANLGEALTPWRGVDGFIAHVLRRSPDAIDVPVVVSYSDERLDAFLERVANQYDQPPQAPIQLHESLTFSSGRPGTALDVGGTRARISAALVSAVTSNVELVVEIGEAPSLDISALAQMVSSLVEEHPELVVGVFAKSLRTGQEVAINAEVAFSGLSLVKIALLEETYRVLDGAPDPRVVDWLSQALGSADDKVGANMLLSDVIGGGDVYLGVETLTMSMGQLRLLNTFIAAPFGEEDVSVTISTPANSREGVYANPTPHMQTTPLDIGLLLEMIYQCSQGGGMLMAVYPDAFTVQECSQMLGWLSGNISDTAVLIETGVPSDVEVLHLHGFTGDTHADAGIVSGSNGDFVLVLFVHRPGWLEWEDSSDVVSDITTAVYNYYAASPR